MTRPDDTRTPPHSLDAEQAVLGGIMLAPSALAQISDWLGEDDFYREDHRTIFRAACDLIARGEPCDAVTLGEWLVVNAPGASKGVMGYVLELANTTPSAANIVAYAEIVREKARLRYATEAGAALVTSAQERGACAGDVVATAMQRLLDIQSSTIRGGLRAAKPIVKAWLADLHRRYDHGDTVTGLPTPWLELNRLTHGLQGGELTVIAARPNMGKSVMGVQIAAFSALRGVRTALFSLEMTETQVMRRAIACTGGIAHDWLLAPVDGDESDWTRVTNASTALVAAPLLVDDTPALSIERLSARAKRAHLQTPLGLIVVDHLHEMEIDGDRAAHDIGRNAQGLKTLGKEFGCPVVVLAQLNRAVAGRTDKRPTMTDLRASGEIEQKADVILFLHREEYYDAATHLQGVVEVEIGKGRDIKTGARVHLRNRYDQMALVDWDGPLPVAPAPAAPSRTRGFTRPSRAVFESAAGGFA